MLGKSLVTLKARFIGIEDGQSLVCQQLWLIYLRHIGLLSQGTRDRKQKAEDKSWNLLRQGDDVHTLVRGHPGTVHTECTSEDGPVGT